MRYLFPILIFIVHGALAQCPDELHVCDRINYLKITNAPFDQQRTELLGYLEKMASCSWKNDTTNALLLQRIGAIYYSLGDFVKSISYSTQAIDMMHAFPTTVALRPDILIRSYNTLRFCYNVLGNQKMRREATDSCIAVSFRTGTGFNYSIPNIYEKVSYFLATGDYFRCIRFADIGAQVAEENNFPAKWKVSFMILKMNALILLKKYVEAEELGWKNIEECKLRKVDSAFGSNFSLLALLTLERGNIKSSLKLYKTAFDYDERAKNDAGCAGTLNNIAVEIYYKRLKDYKTALDYFRKSLKYSKHADSLNAFDNIANVFVQKKNFDSAFYYFQAGFDQIAPGINERDLINHPDIYLGGNIAEYLTNLLLDKADAKLAHYSSVKNQSDLQDVIENYKLVDHVFDNIKFYQSDVESKLFWRSRIRRLYENAIEACYLQKNPLQVFYFFEKSRAVLLQDQLNEQRFFRSEDLAAQSQMLRSISRLKQQLGSGTSSQAHDSTEKEIFTISQQLDGVIARIRDKNKFYYQSVFDTSSVSIRDVFGKIISKDDQLIEMFSGDSAIYIFSVSADNTQLTKLDKIIYDSLSRRFISLISTSEAANQHFDEFASVASQLYQLIFGKMPLAKGRIIISPDGKCFPFEALISSQNSKQPHYFIEDHAISYTYSARFLLNSFDNNKASTSNSFMGFAPVQFSAAFALPSLPGSDESLLRLQSHFYGSDKWTSTCATRNNFLRNYHRYKIIQLYTHATDSGSYKEPVIYFSDSALLLSDLLYENKPATDLIVLSACETGAGKLYEGEGVFSFNRGFAAVGIPSSIANLWQVENTSTYKLTELFYEYLSKGLPVDVALQKAKIDFINTASREKQLPYYWAAPILTGRTDAIQLKKNYTWVFIAAGVCLMAFIVVLVVVPGIRRRVST